VKKGSLLGNILFKRYAGQYEFDWVVVAAQAYQESRFDQSKRSRVGAIGVMQLLPATAADKVVGIPDVSTVENNVHAGVKYLHWLRSTYFSDPQISPLDQILFSLAAYNAGPGNMKRARKRAKQLGFNENRWFGNVEIGMYRAVSGEPASYVRNIYKYYVTYQNLEESRLAREKALKAGPDYHGKMGAEASQETGVGKDSRLSNGALIGIVLGLLALGLVAYWIRNFYRRANSNA
ncbi:MAG: transglycosylase SLT domain-containing protein, partial [Gammaproteobacteria bacterium]|nr:transglycosylase SLT domain-containing protein [Gammaproteobacteria bacterium]